VRSASPVLNAYSVNVTDTTAINSNGTPEEILGWLVPQAVLRYYQL